MLAHVESARSIRTPLLYNEQKVAAKQALFLDAHNFWQEKEDLTLREKQQRFNNLTVLNERSGKKIIHLSVNFHPDDKLSDKEMTRIAGEFMKGIDFGDQPWLLYRHIDAGHPHMHIVSTNIHPDGSRILNDLRAPNHLMKICGNIENRRGLTHALAPRKEIWFSGQDVPSLTYGAMPTRVGIEMVLNYVLAKYAFSSFESFNAILGLYNVRADRGNPDGIMYHNRGLYYRLIDKEGKKLGAPIKASAFHLPVTLDALEEKCKLNQSQVRENDRDSMRIKIDYHLCGKIDNLGKFRQNMASNRIKLVIPAFTRRGTRGARPMDSPGLFYMNFDTMKIFRDTELGEGYTAAAILKRCGLDKSIPEMVRQQQPELKPGERSLLENADLHHAPTRDLFLRLSVEHDRFVEKQQEQERQTQTHRNRHSL